ncbi:GNAT family N-acetyltransferase [Bacillus songklensis]|uniref:GNAT family N-acetyltransferase n=1 Tax=Bacillus songklensis TaxID=1069116 RepID=A0ABV8B793_9BACI
MEIITDQLKLIPCTLKLVNDYGEQGYSFGNHVLESVQHLNSDYSQYGWGVWFVIEKQSNMLVGDMGYKGKPDHEQAVDIGYGILPAHQNKGYATEGAKALINWAFATNKVKKIKAHCLHDNGPSIKVLQKLGMTRIGIQGELIFWELSYAKEAAWRWENLLQIKK